MAETCFPKKVLGTLTGVWVPNDTRDQIVDFVRRWWEKTEIGAILNRTEKSNGGTNRSKGSASGREHQCPWEMHGVLWRAKSSITTTFV
jgi:hypothetical protein